MATMSSEEEDYVLIHSPSSDIISLLSLSDVSSRTPTPPLRPLRRTIHGLGDQLLTRILLTLVSIHRPFVGYEGQYDFGFILASHVCRSWRTIMLACPSIWVEDVFTFPNERAALTILIRTKGLPLDVNLTFQWPRPESWCWSLCSDVLPCIRTLKLSSLPDAASHGHFRRVLNAIITQGAPMLESLDVSQLGVRAQDRFLDVELVAPKLRKLRLAGIFFPCLSATLVSVQLKITRAIWKTDGDVLDVLRGSSDTLEHILFDMIPGITANDTRARTITGPDLHLPSVKTIALRGFDAGILEPLRVPPDTFVCMLLETPVGRAAEASDDLLFTRITDILSLGRPCAISLDVAHEPVCMSILSLPKEEDAHRDQALTFAAHALELVHDLYDNESLVSDHPAHALNPGLLIGWKGRSASVPDFSGEGQGGKLLYKLLDIIRFAAESGEGDLFQPVKCLDICVPDDLLVVEWAYLLKGYTAVDTLRMHIESESLVTALAAHTTTLLPKLTTLIVVINNLDDADDFREYRRVRLFVESLERLALVYLEAGRDSSIEYIRLEGQANPRVFNAETVRERLSVYVPHVETHLD